MSVRKSFTLSIRIYARVSLGSRRGAPGDVDLSAAITAEECPMLAQMASGIRREHRRKQEERINCSKLVEKGGNLELRFIRHNPPCLGRSGRILQSNMRNQSLD